MRRAFVLTALAATLLGCAHTTQGRPITSGAPAEPSASSTPTASPSPTTPMSRTPATRTTPTTSGRTSRTTATSVPRSLQPWYGREWDRLPTRRRLVALTFDAGGDAGGVPSILATLRRERVSATFFLTGNWVERFPADARAIAAAGRIADHSQSHPHFTALSSAQIRNEVLGSAYSIRQVCGANPAPLFRFPYGDRDQRTIEAVNDAGYLPIGWTVDTLGWKGRVSGITATTVVDRVLAAAQPGEIVLMHVGANPDDGSTLDAAALPSVIARIRDLGYGFVSLDALLSMTPAR